VVRRDQKELAKLKPRRHPDVTLEGRILHHPQARPSGWRGTLAAMLKMPLDRKFELDEVGLRVWAACDGKTSVLAISGILQREFKLTRGEAEAALNSFLHTLQSRGLLTL
jgi:hypothetical protein